MQREWRGVPVWVWVLFGAAGVWAGARYLEHRSGANPLTFPLPFSLPGKASRAAVASPQLAGGVAQTVQIPDTLIVQNVAPGRIYVPGVGSFDSAYLTPGQSQQLLNLQRQATGV